MNRTKIAIIAIFLVAIGAVLFFTTRGRRGGGSGSGRGSENLPTSPTPPKPLAQTEITMLYSTEKKDWIEAAQVGFAKQHPEIKVTLVGKGSLEAADAILDGKQQPTVWSPADSLVLGLLDSDWRTKNHEDLFASSGDDAPQPLVITPLVLVIWEDRADALLKASNGELSWRVVHKAVSSNQGWPAVGGKSEWGFVKLGHTDPTRSNSGMQALILMSLEYHKKQSGLEVADVLDPAYQKWIGELERGVGKFETSTGTFMTDMVRFGPSKYDIAVVYENLAIAQIENAQGRWGNLKVYYPQITLWSDHPMALLQAPWVSAAQKEAARLWMAYLRSRPVQERALVYGFRPADPSVPTRGGGQENPFARLAQYGIRVDIPPVATPPEPMVVRNLLTMWSRTVGNR